MRSIKIGDFLRVRISITYIGTKEPVDLTGCSAFTQMRVFPDGELIAEGIASIDAENGLVSAYFSSDQTKNITPGDYGFDIRLVSQDDVKTIYTEQIKFIVPYTMIVPEV